MGNFYYRSTFLLEHSFMLKSYQWGGGVVAHVILDFSVSPSPFGLDFRTSDFGLGLDNKWNLF